MQELAASIVMWRRSRDVSVHTAVRIDYQPSQSLGVYPTRMTVSDAVSNLRSRHLVFTMVGKTPA